MSLGAPVSSLYGALSLIHERFPRCSHAELFLRIALSLAFTDIQESFNLPFRQKAAYLQAGALTS